MFGPKDGEWWKVGRGLVGKAGQPFMAAETTSAPRRVPDREMRLLPAGPAPAGGAGGQLMRVLADIERLRGRSR